MIEIKQLTKSYHIRGGRHYVFQGVDAVFPEGVNIGIIGPNGGGKSTFLRILGGIDYPDSGKIITDRSFSWPLGLKGGFVNRLTGRENCRMVCNLYGLRPREISRKLEQMKELSGIGKYFEEPINTYSSGMGGRLGFALSMAFDFDYFLIDEVTAVGDAHFKALAKEAFEHKTKRSKLIMVSHNMGDIKKFCDVAVLVKNGQLEVFHDLDKAICAYLPQTQEAQQGAEEVIRQATLEEINIASVELPDNQQEFLKAISTLLNSITRKLATPGYQLAGREEDFYIQLSKTYSSLGNEEQALFYIRKAIEANAYSLAAQQRLAQLAAGIGLIEDEKAAIEAAESIDPKNLTTLNAKIQLLVRNREYQKALTVSDMAVRVAPDNAFQWHLRGRILLTLGEKTKALEAQIKAIHYSPQSSFLYRQLAVILLQTEDLKTSMLARQKAYMIDERDRQKNKPHLPPYAQIEKSLKKLDDILTV